MKHPNFFVIGAPKCGTSAVCAYLSKHPNIFITTPKETGFYSPDLNNQRKIPTRAAYLKLYQHATDNHIAMGEGCTQYLYSSVAVPEILKDYPNAKFVVIFRNPIDFIQSWHAQLIRAYTEDVNDLEAAWSLIEQRAMGQRIPTTCRNPKHLDYRNLARFGEQALRLCKTANRDNILFLKYDDLRHSPVEAYARILKHIGAPEFELNKFEQVNTFAVPRSQLVFGVMRHLAVAARKLNLPPHSLIRHYMRNAAKFISSANRRPSKKPILCSSFIESLRLEFAGDIHLLQEVTKLDLSNWLAKSTNDTLIPESKLP